LKPVLGFSFESEIMVQTAIAENLLRLLERIASASKRAGRKPDEVLLIAVSKTHPSEAIHNAYLAGVRHFGENRVQEWEGKRAGLEGLSATWHLIGHLQSNKAARAAKLFHSIDSLDNEALAQKLDRAPTENPVGEKIRVLIEVHLGGEATKSGVSSEQLPALVEKIVELEHLNLAGFMCIPPFHENKEHARPHFAFLRSLREQMETRFARRFPVLSMGMSHDFEAAIQEGSTEVRIGTALFGQRPSLK
jgi:PLP dependent protein